MCHEIEGRTSFNIHPLRFLLVPVILHDLRQDVLGWNCFVDHALVYYFSTFKNLGTLMSIAYACKWGGLRGEGLVPNLGKHSHESIGEMLVSFDVEE